MERCRAEIAAVEAQIRAGHPDVQGLCLALADLTHDLLHLRAQRRLGLGQRLFGLHVRPHHQRELLRVLLGVQ